MGIWCLFVILCQIFVVSSYADEYSSQSLLNDEEINQLFVTTDDIRTENYQKFSENLQILERNKKTFSPFQHCYYDYLSAYQLSLSGNFKLANEQFSVLFAKCEDIRIKIRVKALQANLYAIAGEYHKAISHLDFIISHIDDIKDITTKYYAYVPAFIVYDMVDQRELSLKFAELLIDEKPPEKYLCKGLLFKYKALMEPSYQSNLEHKIRSVIKQCKQSGEMIYAQALNVVWLKSRLRVSKTDDNFNNLLKILLESDNDIEKTKYKNLINVKNSLFAEIYEKLGNSEKAFEYANLAINGSFSIGTTEQKIDALQVLINYHQNNKDYQAANKYLIEKNQADKKLYSDTQAKLMAYQTVKHDSLAKTLQIESLNRKNDVLQLEEELAVKSKINQRLLNSIFATLILLFLYAGFRIKKQQKQYKKLSELDHMTSIYNRKGVKDYMDYLLPYSKKKNEIIAYGTFDLDMFKKVNDKYGHLTGDWVIKAAVLACQNLNNAKATFARLGGEEFSIIIRDASLDEIKQFSEQCRQAIYTIKTLEQTGCNFQISASFGITTTELSGYEYSDLMRNADTALYTAKNNGRNQIAIYESA
ncbi:MAG: GGDEF domain-containing protein [Alcanivoracaceae bacterium]|nr:GGDEF domain-containing protein [Alcanivoracaceae bacterium]